MSKKKSKKNKVQKKAWYKNMKIVIPVAIAVLIVGLLLTLFLTGVIKMPSQPAKNYSSPTPMVIDVNKKYTALIKTAKGELVLELYPQDAPVTVNNFVTLARKSFYNGLTFHRIIPGFMAQGGDPSGNGTGGPGYKFQDEFSSRTHQAGSLSMANSGPNTNGSQFFICYEPQAHLNGKHTVFGQLTQGMDVLKNLVVGDKMNEVVITESN